MFRFGSRALAASDSSDQHVVSFGPVPALASAATGKNRSFRTVKLVERLELNVPRAFTGLVRTLDALKTLNVPTLLLLPILWVNRIA